MPEPLRYMPKKPYERIQLVTPELFLVSVKALRAASTFKTMICGTMRSMAGSDTITYRELNKLIEDAVDSTLNVDDFPAPPAQSAVPATSAAAPTFCVNTA